MATLKDYKINKNRGVRPDDYVIQVGKKWFVEKGEPYDLVQFSINEVKGFYWGDSLCVPTTMTEDEVKKLVDEEVKNISDTAVKSYNDFLDEGSKYGWD